MSNNYNREENQEIQAIKEAREEKLRSFKLDYTQNLDSSSFDDNSTLSSFDEDNEINSYSGEDVKEQMTANSKKMLKKQKRLKKKEEKKKNKKNKRIFRFIWLISAVFVGVVLSVYLMVGVNDMLAINRTDDTTYKLELPESPSLDLVTEKLVEGGVINEATFFKMYAGLTKSGDNFNQGVFDIPRNLDYEAVINYIQGNTNRTDTVTITIPEGKNINEISELLVEQKVLKSTDEFLKLCNSNEFDEDYEFLKSIPNADKRYYKLEGYLYPDTYTCYINEDPALTISRFLSNFEVVMYSKQTVDGYDKRIVVNDKVEETEYSIDEILTIASIIQAEAADDKDMYYISSVIHNRLDNGVEYGTATLDMDSTVFYPYRSEDVIPSSEKSTFKSTYNTYEFQGLPPGPICSPGLKAIMAAINPKDTNYMYFCHSKEGEAFYAETFEGHQYNLSIAGVSN